MNINRALPDNISIFSNDSHQSIQSCRICMESVNDLKQFCLCSGYVSVIHKSCLLKWITISNASKCEICSKEFKLIKGTKIYWKHILIAIFVLLFIIGIYIYIYISSYMFESDNKELYLISVVTTLVLIGLAINNTPQIFYTKILDIDEYYDNRGIIEYDHTQLSMYNKDTRDMVLPEIIESREITETTETTDITEATQLIHVNR